MQPQPTLTQEIQTGLQDLRRRFTSAGLEVIRCQRGLAYPEGTYFEVGIAGRSTDVVLSDEFISDLPATPEYGPAVDSYAKIVAFRAQCGSPESFYCLSGLAIRSEIRWPVEFVRTDSAMFQCLRVELTNQIDASVAFCAVRLPGSYAFAPNGIGTTFDKVRLSTNAVRIAIDQKIVNFYPSRPEIYQWVELKSMPILQSSREQIEKFLVQKVYVLGFQVRDEPNDVWVIDPWDAEYLGVPPKELAQCAQILKAKHLIDFSTSREFARPSDKLLAEWPDTLASFETAVRPQRPNRLSLPNKEKLLSDADALLKTSAPVAIVVIDLDHFKQVNDTNGHSAGDQCLDQVVAIIADVLGRRGTLYRWGGDEFAVCLPDFSLEEAYATAERIRRAIEEGRCGGNVPVTGSVGVAAATRSAAVSAEKLLNEADKATYESKHSGKNRVTLRT